MKKILIVLAIVVVAFCSYWFLIRSTPKDDSADSKSTLVVTKIHSGSFNNNIDSLLTAYLRIKNAFVNADTNTAKMACTQLIQQADSSWLAELKAENEGIYQSAVMQIGDVKANAESLLRQSDITEMRQDFRMIGESVYPLLKTIHYEGGILYWQHCPMAFGEDKGANWISSTKEIINPYLGKNHPEFKGTMLHCGEVKDSIKAQ